MILTRWLPEGAIHSYLKTVVRAIPSDRPAGQPTFRPTYYLPAFSATLPLTYLPPYPTYSTYPAYIDLPTAYP